MPLFGEPQEAILVDINGNALAAQPATAIPASTPGLLGMGSDGTNARYLTVDTSGRLTLVGPGTAGTPAGGVLSIQGVAGGTALPISAASLPLPAGAATEATLANVLTTAAFQARVNTLGQKTSANSTPIVIASDQSAIPVTGTFSATFASVGLTGAAVPTSADQVGGTDGTNLRAFKVFDLDTGAGADYNLGVSIRLPASGGSVVGGTPTDPFVVEGPVATGVAPTQNPNLVAGWDGTLTRSILTDTSGRVVVAPPGTNATTAGFALGQMTTTATAQVPVRATTYNEPSVNAQRSISSASANDTAAGTGARTVKITYYTQTGSGPFTETVTLNGTTAVNTVSTTICFVESMVVQTAGSGGVNAGIITLFNAVAAGGGTLGTIAAGDNRTLWAQHYVALGETCYVTAIAGQNNNTSNATDYALKSKAIGVANAAEIQVSDFVRSSAGQATVTRTYGTAIPVVGPARLLLYGAPNGTSSIISRASFDYYEQ